MQLFRFRQIFSTSSWHLEASCGVKSIVAVDSYPRSNPKSAMYYVHFLEQIIFIVYDFISLSVNEKNAIYLLELL